MNQKEHKILIIEDDYRLSKEWQIALIEAGFVVDEVTNSTEAELLLANNYDAFIIDLFHVKDTRFLKDGGIRAIPKIRRYEKNNTLKKSLIIAVSGYSKNGNDGYPSTAETVDFLGADMILRKPVEISTIIQFIKIKR